MEGARACVCLMLSMSGLYRVCVFHASSPVACEGCARICMRVPSCFHSLFPSPSGREDMRQGLLSGDGLRGGPYGAVDVVPAHRFDRREATGSIGSINSITHYSDEKM